MNETLQNGRDARGKFAAGNKIGRGRPRREVEAAYLSAFYDGVPEEQLRRIVAAIALKAEAGSIAAARLLLSHLMPSQQLRIELASSDEEYRVAGQSPEAGMKSMMDRINKKVLEARARKQTTNEPPPNEKPGWRM